jgi:ribose transport system ATP-binding protein
MGEELLRVEKISKSFSSVRALDSVSFDLKTGEVHALLGENGAGKSTLMKIISGVYIKDGGEIFLHGNKVDINSPHTAQRLGIGIIHQELNLCRHLSVSENIFLGREFGLFGFLQKKEQRKKALELLQQLNVDINPDTLVGNLTVAKQQMVEICKTLSLNAQIIIMDEPTSALSEKEIDDLFLIIQELKAQGKGIIYISHRLEELSRITDRVTILRDGNFISTNDFNTISLDQIIQKMVGRKLNEKFPRIPSNPGRAILEVNNLSTYSGVENVSFKVHSDEILGIAGLVGAGRTETLRGIFGADICIQGEVALNGKKISIKNPADAIKNGIFLVPEDRKHDGLCTKLSVFDNLTLPNLDLYSVLGVLKQSIAACSCNKIIESLQIKTPSLNQYASNLSGGNQQKIVVGKWLMRKARVVMFDEPTRGIDVAAKIQIYKIMNELKEQGIGVVFVSSELPEILGMADKIAVMCNGKITAMLNTNQTNQEEILKYSTIF